MIKLKVFSSVVPNCQKSHKSQEERRKLIISHVCRFTL